MLGFIQESRTTTKIKIFNKLDNINSASIWNKVKDKSKQEQNYVPLRGWGLKTNILLLLDMMPLLPPLSQCKYKKLEGGGINKFQCEIVIFYVT